MFNAAGTTSAGLVVLDEGSRQLALFGANGNPSVTVTQDEAGTVGFVLCDRSGAPRGTFVLAPDGQPRLPLVDAEGRTVFEAPEAAEFEYGAVAEGKSTPPAR